MKVIIDIPNDLYNKYKNDNNIDDIHKWNILSFIRKGIPLDKIRDEIEQASYEHYFEYGEYIGEDTRKERIINTNKVLQIFCVKDF